jgi:heme o synthase
VNDRVRAYYRLTKPGIIYGNLFTAAGGFLFGAILRVNVWHLLAALVGTGFAVNNYFDQDIDKVMKRTKSRALVTGAVSPQSALIFAAILGCLGLLTLLIFTNGITTFLGIIGFVSYAFIYTFAKRKTVHGTLIGTLPGALPPVAGYTAATGNLDVSALLLLLILVFWQMAHFYAISIFRIKDYRAAKIPVMPVVHGVWATKIQMLMYASAFLLSIVLLAKMSYAGVFYLAIMVPLSFWWVFNTLLGLWTDDDVLWARKVFFISLLMLPAFGIMLALNAWLP